MLQDMANGRLENEFRNLSAQAEDIILCFHEGKILLSRGEDDTLTIMFERLMAKISLKIDRSRLSEDVMMNVRTARICNCPKMVRICGPGSVTSHDQCFASGFSRNEFETFV